jgi:hypothetical protein
MLAPQKLPSGQKSGARLFQPGARAFGKVSRVQATGNRKFNSERARAQTARAQMARRKRARRKGRQERAAKGANGENGANNREQRDSTTIGHAAV